jgi:hypothetical protein
MRSQLQQAKSPNTALWFASQLAAMDAAKLAPFATEFKTLFTAPNVNELNLEAHPARQGSNSCELLLTADHFLEVIEPILEVIKVIFSLRASIKVFVGSFTQSRC